MGVGGENIDQFETAEDVCGGKESLGDQVRIVGIPVFSLEVRQFVPPHFSLFLHLKDKQQSIDICPAESAFNRFLETL